MIPPASPRRSPPRRPSRSARNSSWPRCRPGESIDGLYPLGPARRPHTRRGSQREEHRHEVPQDPARIRGRVRALVTPFTADGEVDHESLPPWPAGSWSPAATALDRRLHRRAQRAVGRRTDRRDAQSAEVIDDRVPFLPGTGTAKLDETLELTAAAREPAPTSAGDHPVLRPAHPGGAVPLVLHRREEFPDLPMVAYNVPSGPPWRSTRRPWPGCAAPTTTSSGSRRRPRTSSTSRTCCTCRAGLRWSGRASSCCACRCWRWAGSASSARPPTSPPRRPRRCTSVDQRRPRRRPATCTSPCTRW